MSDFDELKNLARMAGFVRQGGQLRCGDDGSRDPIMTTLARFAALVRADAKNEEREACARECERNSISGEGYGFAAAIRARGVTDEGAKR